MNTDPHNEITVFAKTNFRGKAVPFGIKTDDRRRHMYVIGKTGMGKTTLMENMIIQDIMNGKGLAFVDPHGDSVEKILDYIPSSRVNDVVYFNPADQEFPIALNILEAVDSSYKHLVASGLMGVFTKIWANTWSARMEYILNNSILALLDSPGNTLLGIARMMVDKKYRKKIVDNIKDPMVRSFWVDEFANWQDKYRMEAVAPIQNKVGQFLSSSIVRNIIGQPRSTIDLRDIMDNKKIFLMNLSKGRLGEDNSALLGAMLITKLQLAALSRVDILEHERSDFYLYVDEFQNFATQSFATILSEARKYRLNLIVGHQYIGQLVQQGNTDVRDAVFGNVGTMVTFRVGAADAEFLEKEFFPTFVQNDLVNLPKHHIILRLMINGVASDPFTATTLAPTTYQKTPNRDKVIRVSRERYANPVQQVVQKITQWMGQEYHEGVAVVATGAKFEGRDDDEELAPQEEGGSEAAAPQNAAQQSAAAPVIAAQTVEVMAPEVRVSQEPPSEPQQQQNQMKMRAEMILPDLPPRVEAEYQPEEQITVRLAEAMPQPKPAVPQAAPQNQQRPHQNNRPANQRSEHGQHHQHSHQVQNHGQHERPERRNPARRKASNNNRKENPIWDKVADLSSQKNKELANTLAKTIAHKPQPKPVQPRREEAAVRHQSGPQAAQPVPPVQPELRADRSADNSGNPVPGHSHSTSAGDQSNNRIVLKPGEKAKF